ncbi:Nse1 non-SMC component of SMC5-6 complex-domain-containing protein [Sparassis latifolia]
MVSSNDVQRLFLQSMLSRRIISQKLALKIWEKCVEAVRATDDSLEIPFSSDRNSWDNFVSNINNALNPLDLEFAHMHDEYTGKEMCVLVNRRGDEIAQMATDYSAVEIAYFKAVVEQIMLAPNESYTVSSLAALREVGTLKANMTKTQAEVVLSSFVAKGWLVKSREGRYSLSTRTLLELQPYLRSTYPDEIIECTICMEMITRGVACYTAHCKTRLHTHCFNNYRRRNQNCPTCNENWSADANARKLLSIGEGAFKDGQDKGSRRAPRKSAAEGDEDEDEEMDVEPSPSQLSQLSRS